MKGNHQLWHSVLSAIPLCITTVGGSQQIHADTPGSTTRQEALQSCPAVEEEILDLEILAKGLRQSEAISFLDKIRLKSEIDVLVDRMQSFQQGKRTYSTAELQEQYDVLLMKIAAHLQHKDTILHKQLCNAWEMIWLDLEDPARFKEKFS